MGETERVERGEARQRKTKTKRENKREEEEKRKGRGTGKMSEERSAFTVAIGRGASTQAQMRSTPLLLDRRSGQHPPARRRWREKKTLPSTGNEVPLAHPQSKFNRQ